MLIPPERLEKTTLIALVEEYITREGTDYGMEELELSTKVEQVLQQLNSGQVVIVFDAASETTQLVSQEVYQGEYEQ